MRTKYTIRNGATNRIEVWVTRWWHPFVEVYVREFDFISEALDYINKQKGRTLNSLLVQIKNILIKKNMKNDDKDL